MRTVTSSCLGVLLVASQFAWTPRVSADVQYDDHQLETRIRSDLSHLHIEDLDVQVLGYGVTLAGTAESLAQTRDAVERAQRQPGIQEVFNDLHVVSVADDVLQSAILAAIEKAREHYTVYDLVHVVVSDGQVFLSGHALDTNTEKAIEKTVSKVRGVSSINNGIDTTRMPRAAAKLQTNLVFIINRALAPYPYANPSFHVMVRAGHVSLSGFVEGKDARRAVENAVTRTNGVLSVANTLRSRRESE